MNIEQMKLAVCEKLPELVEISQRYKSGYCVITTPNHDNTKWNDGRLINWPAEGLQVCHEAEKLLDDNQWERYWYALHRITPGRPTCVCHATHEQRLEALCRVWYPERFVK